jgi:hypothetical protein
VNWSELREENQGDAYGDQEGAQEEDEAYAEEEADGASALLGGFSCGEDGRGGIAIVQKGAEKCEIRDHPESNFVARLPEQINSGADDQQPDDTEKLGHD